MKTNTKTNVDTAPSAITSINEKLILVRLRVQQWGGRKFDKLASDQLAKLHGKDDSADVGRFNKILVDRDALLPVMRARSELINRHYHLTAPWTDDGVRVLTSQLFMEYTKQIREANAEYLAAAKHFADDVYPTELAIAEKRLGTLFKATDYPSVDEIRDAFGSSVHFEPLPNPEDVRVWGIGDKAAREIEQSVRSSVQEGIDAAHQHVAEALLGRAQEFVKKVQAFDAWQARETEREKFEDALRAKAKEYVKQGIDPKEARARALEESPPRPAPVKGEETRGLRESAIENLREIVGVVLSGLNVKNDPALTDLARQLEVSMRGVDVDHLRNAEKVRKTKVEEVERIANKFAGVFGPTGGAR